MRPMNVSVEAGKRRGSSISWCTLRSRNTSLVVLFFNEGFLKAGCLEYVAIHRFLSAVLKVWQTRHCLDKKARDDVHFFPASYCLAWIMNKEKKNQHQCNFFPHQMVDKKCCFGNLRLGYRNVCGLNKHKKSQWGKKHQPLPQFSPCNPTTTTPFCL